MLDFDMLRLRVIEAMTTVGGTQAMQVEAIKAADSTEVLADLIAIPIGDGRALITRAFLVELLRRIQITPEQRALFDIAASNLINFNDEVHANGDGGEGEEEHVQEMAGCSSAELDAAVALLLSLSAGKADQPREPEILVPTVLRRISIESFEPGRRALAGLALALFEATPKGQPTPLDPAHPAHQEVAIALATLGVPWMPAAEDDGE